MSQGTKLLTLCLLIAKNLSRGVPELIVSLKLEDWMR